MQMAAIKTRNEDFDIISNGTTGSFRDSRQSASKNGSQKSVSLDFSASNRSQRPSKVTKVIKISQGEEI